MERDEVNQAVSIDRRPQGKATGSGKLVASITFLVLSWGTLTGCNCRAVNGEELADSGNPDAGDAGACLIEDPCPVSPGGELFVDSVDGSDGPCCCGSQARPCRTLTHATQMIGAVRAESVTIHALNGDHSLVWNAPEAWPVTLSLGTHLEAPDIYFVYYDGGGPFAFCASAWDADDSLEVAITGAEVPDGGLLHVQVPPDGNYPDYALMFTAAIAAGNQTFGPNCAIPDGGATVPVRVSNVWVNGEMEGIFLGPGGALTLGPYPVWVGGQGANLGQLAGSYGLFCRGGLANPSSIQDVGTQVLHVDSYAQDLSVESYCSVSLTHGPIFGLAPDGGINTCSSPVNDVTAVEVGYHAFAELGSAEEPATIQCQQQDGIDIPRGVDSPVIFQGTIRNCVCYASQVHGGTLYLVGSQITYDWGGIWVADEGSVDLTGVEEGTNRVYGSDLACNTGLENENRYNTCPDSASPGLFGPYGAALINTSSSATVNAENLLWNVWDPDAGMPQVWSCVDPVALTGCTCHGPGCVPDAGPFPAYISALYLEGNPHPFDFADGGLSPRNCGQDCTTDDAGVTSCVPI